MGQQQDCQCGTFACPKRPHANTVIAPILQKTMPLHFSRQLWCKSICYEFIGTPSILRSLLVSCHTKSGSEKKRGFGIQSHLVRLADVCNARYLISAPRVGRYIYLRWCNGYFLAKKRPDVFVGSAPPPPHLSFARSNSQDGSSNGNLNWEP